LYQNVVNEIIEYYDGEFTVDKLYILQNKKIPALCYITYNVTSDKEYFDKTIALHRKKGFNTLYTLDGLNAIVRLQNNGQEDKSFSVDWDPYKNSIVLAPEGNINVIHTSLLDICELE
jgi:hypothetical protein